MAGRARAFPDPWREHPRGGQAWCWRGCGGLPGEVARSGVSHGPAGAAVMGGGAPRGHVWTRRRAARNGGKEPPLMGSGRPALLGAPRTHRRTSGPLSCAGGFMRPVSPGGPLPDFTGTPGGSPQSSVVPLGPESPRPRVLSVGRMWGPGRWRPSHCPTLRIAWSKLLVLLLPF